MIYAMIFMLGACIGSFINVIFSRKDWYKGRSRCDSCGYTLKWYDLIPIISYLTLLGKCRKCKKNIDACHFISELYMGTAFVISYVCFLKYSLNYALLSAIALFFMAIYAIEDTKEQMIYAALLDIGVILTGIFKAYMLYCNSEHFDILMLFLTIVLFKTVFSFISFPGIGNGDFDIILIIYILFSDYGTVFCMAVSSFIGCAIYLPAVILKKYDKKQPLAFAPLLFMGTMLCLAI
ncbi:MAG: prepilin peptidase [Eubacteriales bacterium]|nr:prepilin peptidase [Eubacteriales bacterium]